MLNGELGRHGFESGDLVKLDVPQEGVVEGMLELRTLERFLQAGPLGLRSLFHRCIEWVFYVTVNRAGLL